MKRILLDTHALLWWLSGDIRLGQDSIEIIASQDNDIFVSAVSVWEIAIKKKKGLLLFQINIHRIIRNGNTFFIKPFFDNL